MTSSGQTPWWSWVWPAVAWAVLLATALACLRQHQTSDFIYRQKTLVIAPVAPDDAWLGYAPRAVTHDAFIVSVLEAVQRLVPPEKTLLTVPEGSQVNYLARRTSSFPFTVMSLTEMRAWGPAMAEAFRRAPPDFVLMLDRDSGAQGGGPFGAPGNGEDLVKLIEASYTVVWGMGAQPWQGKGYGVRLMRRVVSAGPGL